MNLDAIIDAHRSQEQPRRRAAAPCNMPAVTWDNFQPATVELAAEPTAYDKLAHACSILNQMFDQLPLPPRIVKVLVEKRILEAIQQQLGLRELFFNQSNFLSQIPLTPTCLRDGRIIKCIAADGEEFEV